MQDLLAIVGPTATGKTARALSIANTTPSILISADSRQVYRSMDIVTGKDHPANTILYGIDIVNPDESCSVAVWYDSVIPHIRKAWEDGKKVIVVGGTGLYVKALTHGIATLSVPINQSLRDELGHYSVKQLQYKLRVLNETKLNNMNHSDQHNPRRLIRAIEVALSLNPLSFYAPTLTTQMIGLRCSDDSYYRKRITTRVVSRIEQGAIEETKGLLEKYGKHAQSMSAIGYESIIKYLENVYNKQQLIENWVAGELAYAKRQLTFFSKLDITWYDCCDDNNQN